ncbi:MAG: permease prefix domain 1-containing protein [Defluviitaleaceae bacterium]|nr:permease prefix domain 1-containing protein [Defluviitaleaceae bacterium]
MEAIKTYLDNVFAAYPQTDEVQTLKQDMLANMHEKYNMLRQNGKSEHEAAYSVIADFGNIEEITAELGLNSKSSSTEESIFLSWDEAEDYVKKTKRSGMLIGLGVWLIIAGVSSVVFFGHAFLMFVAVAISVTMFIIVGSKMGRYEPFEKTSLRFDARTREIVENERTRFVPRCTAMVAIGVAIIILTVGAFTITEIPVPLFLNIIGFSVFLFIMAGYITSAYDVLLDKGDYVNKEATKKSGRIIGVIAAFYWPITTAVALWLLFTGHTYFWVVWPVAGVLFGGIAGGIGIWHGTKEKEKAQ